MQRNIEKVTLMMMIMTRRMLMMVIMRWMLSISVVVHLAHFATVDVSAVFLALFSRHILTLLLGDIFTLLLWFIMTHFPRHLDALGSWIRFALLPGHVLTFFLGDSCAGLSGHRAAHLSPDFWTIFLGNWPALLLRYLDTGGCNIVTAVLSLNISALFLVHIFTLLHRNKVALLFRHLFTFLFRNLLTHLSWYLK